jgi:hypothetical protein
VHGDAPEGAGRRQAAQGLQGKGRHEASRAPVHPGLRHLEGPLAEVRELSRDRSSAARSGFEAEVVTELVIDTSVLDRSEGSAQQFVAVNPRVGGHILQYGIERANLQRVVAWNRHMVLATPRAW